MLVAPVPMNAPPLNTATGPRTAGSMMPKLFRVMLIPVRSMAWPPSVASICAPLLTLTVRLSSVLAKSLGINGCGGTPVQVTVDPAVLQVANAIELNTGPSNMAANANLPEQREPLRQRLLNS